MGTSREFLIAISIPDPSQIIEYEAITKYTGGYVRLSKFGSNRNTKNEHNRAALLTPGSTYFEVSNIRIVRSRFYVCVSVYVYIRVHAYVIVYVCDRKVCKEFGKVFVGERNEEVKEEERCEDAGKKKGKKMGNKRWKTG